FYHFDFYGLGNVESTALDASLVNLAVDLLVMVAVLQSRAEFFSQKSEYFCLGCAGAASGLCIEPAEASGQKRSFFMKKFLALPLSIFSIALFVGLILQHEWHLAKSESIFVELAPVDPRSILQGDYMALNYQL